jgi:hypothetical protein
MRYRNYHIAIDSFGLFGLLLGLSYYYFDNIGASLGVDKDGKIYSLWGNLATELVSIWLGVRIIDYLIQKNEKEHSIRMKVVDDTRTLLEQIRKSIEHTNEYELDYLFTQLTKTMPGSRKYQNRTPYLSEDEIHDLQAFYKAVIDWQKRLNNLATATSTGTSNSAQLRQSLWKQLGDLEDKQSRVEDNILVETEEE